MHDPRLTDVHNNAHYQRTVMHAPPTAFDVETWAEHDVVMDWHAGLGSESNVLSAIELLEPGAGYTSTPTVVISGGGGSMARAFAIVENGSVVGVELLNPGRRYRSLPDVQIVGGGASVVARARALQ